MEKMENELGTEEENCGSYNLLFKIVQLKYARMLQRVKNYYPHMVISSY